MMGINPFLVSVVVALVVLVAVVWTSHRRSETQVATGANAPASASRNIPSLLAVVVVLAVCLLPFGIAAAALSGPPFGFAAFFALLAVGLIALGASRRRGR